MSVPPNSVLDGLSEEPAANPPPFTYAFDFDQGLGPWTSWMAPSVVTEPDGLHESFTRLQASGPLDANHIDGIGAIWLVAYLSTPTLGSPGYLNLHDAEFQITMRGTDFNLNGGKLVVWTTRYVPETGLTENYYFGLQVTNWANTGADLSGNITDEWVTVTLQISDDPADWTYAGNFGSFEGDWADRYAEFDLQQTLSSIDATLHLVVLNEDPDAAPSGFLDLANITVRTQTPAVAAGGAGTPIEVFHSLEDQVATGTLAGNGTIDPLGATYALIPGSATNGVAVIDSQTGTFTFTPPADFYGPSNVAGYATFQYTISNGGVTSAPITVVVYVGGINDAPVVSARDEALEIAASVPFEHTLTSGTDVDGNILSFEVVSGSVVGGTVSVDALSGRYVFTPTAGFSGVASFRYTLSDGQLNSAEKLVELTVLPSGQTPARLDFGGAEALLIAGDIPGWTQAAILLADAGDTNAAYHYGTWLNDGINGVARNRALAREYLELAVDRVPDANLQLATLFASGEGGPRDYGRARDLLEALPNDATALYRLANMDDRGLGGPVDAARAVEGYLQAASLGSAEAAYTLGRRYLEGQGVAASPEDAYFWLGIGLKFNAQPANEVFRDLLRNNQALAATDLTPQQIAALDTAIAGWTFGDPSPVNDAPVLGGDDTVTLPAQAGQPVTGTLAAGTDADGDRLTFSLVESSAQNGALTLNASTGAFIFTSTPGYGGPAGFSYVVSDGQTTSAPRQVQFAVQIGTAAGADAGSTDEATVLSVAAAVGLLTNDFVSPAAGPLRVSAVNGQATAVGQSVSGEYGSIVVQPDGSYVFTPSAAARNLLQGTTATQTFTYTVIDAVGVSSTATLTLTINGLDGVVTSGSGVITGTAFADVITGSSGYDVLLGLDGNDRLIGGPGSPDELYGGLGDDTYVLENAGSSIIENADAGVDTIETAASSQNLAANVENLTYTGSAAFTGVGNGLANVIRGGTARDVLIGLGGNDILIGGEGASDELYGGAGDDIYIVATTGDTIIESAGEGTDTIQTALAAYTMAAANVENLTYTGAGNFTGTGDAQANVITGASGDDTLAGRGGIDRLVGGLGIDTASYANAAAAVDVRLNSNAARNDGDGATDVLVGIENLTGSAFNDLLIGDAGTNVLSGGAGRDTLLGMDGDDTLIGGDGVANQMQGGRGDDTYVVSAIGDSIVEFADEGTDTVQTTLTSFRLAAQIENLTALGNAGITASGNAMDNVITGGEGRDVLLGFDGNDTLIGGSGMANQLQGGLGDDTYVVSAADTVIELAGQGYDTVQTALAAHTLRAEVEALVYTGSGNFAGTGNASANAITGGTGNDTLKGMGGDDVLTGGAGNDLVLLQGLQADYSFEAVEGGWRVTDATAGRDGIDLLYGIETVRFSNGQTLDLTTLAPMPVLSAKDAGPQVLPVIDLPPEPLADVLERLHQPPVQALDDASLILSPLSPWQD